MTDTFHSLPLDPEDLARRTLWIGAIGNATGAGFVLTGGGMGGDSLLFIACAGIGGGFGGALTAHLFGRPTPSGDWLALLGAVLATFCGASIGGALMELLSAHAVDSLGALLLGPVFVVFAFTQAPLVGFLCLMAFVALHLHLKRGS